MVPASVAPTKSVQSNDLEGCEFKSRRGHYE